MKLARQREACPNTRALIVERVLARGWSPSGCWRVDGRWRRRLRLTGAEIAVKLGMPLATVSRWLKRIPAGSTHYNYRRRHGSLSHRPPAARLHELTGAT